MGPQQEAPPPQSPWQLAFARLRRDRLAVAAACVVAIVAFACFAGAPLLSHLLGHGPDTPFDGAVPGYTPVGFWSHVPVNPAGRHEPTTLFVLGADSTVGRDELLRLLYGGQVTIEVAAGTTLLAMLLGTMLGTLAGYRGGRTDAVVLWVIEFAMAFPVLLVAIALGSAVSDDYAYYTLDGLFQPGVLSITIFIALFAWMYPARLARVQVLELRERPFVEAARMAGASGSRIMRSHIVPHVLPTLIAPATIMFAATMLLQASLSMLGVGIDPNTPSWGGMLALKVGWLTALSTPDQFSLADPLVLYPSAAILLTVAAAAMLGEQVRKALDPTGT
jgi:peptide/nickel transport system permease protein